jgi:hypothetical protein
MEEPKQYQGSFKWRRWLAILIVIGAIVGLIVSFSQFSLGYLGDALLFRQLIYCAASFLVALFIYKLPEPKPDLNRARLTTTIIFTIGGATLGIAIAFLGGGIFLSAILGGPVPVVPIRNAVFVFSFVVAPIIGGYVGYLISKGLKDSYFGFGVPE